MNHFYSLYLLFTLVFIVMNHKLVKRKIAKTITDYALEMQVDTIVFEHLDTKGKKKGSKKQKLTMWKKNTIQKIVENKAHRKGSI